MDGGLRAVQEGVCSVDRYGIYGIISYLLLILIVEAIAPGKREGRREGSS